jgi:hypothetical protein
LFGPIAQVGEEFEKALCELPTVKQAVDELILLDNTAEGQSPRVIAQFVNGEIVKVAQSIPHRAQLSFGREFTRLMAHERSRPERAGVGTAAFVELRNSTALATATSDRSWHGEKEGRDRERQPNRSA